MTKILAIGGSNSSKSINKAFATYVANKLEDATVTVLDWNELVLPLYSPDLEQEQGIPEKVHNFMKQIQETDGIVLSLAEYNGLPTAAFKNLWDWTSRIDPQFWSGKPMLLSAASPGGRGGANVLKIMEHLMPFFGGNLIEIFSLPFFYQNFKEGKLVNDELLASLEKKITSFKDKL